MELSNIDLNLLRTLDALLQERSVTRAAVSLGVSQPAVSLALSKLRRQFNDELLRRTGNTYDLTPLALQLREQVTVAISGVRRVFEAQPEFDPRTAHREFTLLCSDYGMAVLGAALRNVARDSAPHVVLRLESHTPPHVDHAEEVLRTIDGLVLPHGFVSGLPHTDLFADDWVCLVATTNPYVGDHITMQQLAELPWAYTYLAPNAFTSAGRQLQILGLEPRVEMVVASFMALPFVIAGTDRVGLMQRRLADRLADSAEVRAVPCPFDAVPIVEALWWHPMYDRDPAHAWLRATVAEAGRLLSATDPDKPR